MKDLSDPHEEIRFHKREIKNLDHYPSAINGDGIKVKTPKTKRKPSKRLRRFFYWFLGTLSFFLLLVVILLKVGISGSFLTSKMQTVLREQLGAVAEASISNAKLSLDEDFHIALEAQDVHLNDIQGGTQLDQIGTFKLGLSTLGLLRGSLQIEQIEFHDANLILPKSQGGNIMDILPQDDYGRVDLDALADGVFPNLDKAIATLKKLSIQAVILKNVSVKMAGENAKTVSVDEFKLANNDEKLAIAAQLVWNNKLMKFEASSRHDNEEQGENLDLKLISLPLHLGAADGISPFLANGRTNNGHFRLKGDLDIAIHADRKGPKGTPAVHMQIAMAKGELDIGTELDIPTSFDLNFEHEPESGKIEIPPSHIIIGGLNVPFNGAVGPVPLGEGETTPVSDYRFEVVSHDAVSAPTESPESALKFAAKIAGQFKLSDKKADIQQVSLNTQNGNLIGQGSLRFGEGTPETIFVLQVPQMDVSDVKQLWPVNISPGARRWVLSHIFGGKISNGVIEIALPLGFFKSGIPSEPLNAKHIRVKADVTDTRSDIVGDLPALRNATGKVNIEGTTTTVSLDHGLAYVSDNKMVQARAGTLVIPWGIQRPVYAEMNMLVSGDVKSAGELISFNPINARDKLPFNPDIATGNVEAQVNIRFPVTKDNPRGEITYNANTRFNDFSLGEPVEDILIKNANGTAFVSKSGVTIVANGLMNDLPASVNFVQPFAGSDLKKSEKITLKLDDATRQKHFSFLNMFLSGPVNVDISSEDSGQRHLKADLTNTIVEFPWVGWKKGKGIEARAELDIPSDISKRPEYSIRNFQLSGVNLQVAGTINIKNKDFLSADFSKANLNRNDNMSLKISRSGKAYRVDVNGKSYDARSLVQQMGKRTSGTSDSLGVILNAKVDEVSGFNNEILTNVNARYESGGQNSYQLALGAKTRRAMPVDVQLNTDKGAQSVIANSADAGAVLRFMNYYDKIEGGTLKARLQSQPNQPLSGPVSIRNFAIVNEPKLAKLVSSTPSSGGKSLNDAVKGRIDSSRLAFDVAYAHIGKGDNYVVLDRGVVRGPTVGATFQGILYDASGNISITGTFMPAYGINRLFGDLPIIGQVLGNGRDRGLIGITFKIEGNAKQPQIMVNPISAIAPGIFRQIFEFQ